MNQGKLEVVKQAMSRVNVDILGISELKWTGMGEFNSDTISKENPQDTGGNGAKDKQQEHLIHRDEIKKKVKSK